MQQADKMKGKWEARKRLGVVGQNTPPAATGARAALAPPRLRVTPFSSA